MSFCSYEEAWGSPFESDLKNEHVTKENDVPIISNNQNNPNNHNELEGSNGIVETAPLTGSLLGGAIPKEQWKTNEISENKIPSFEDKFDKKMDQLVNTIEKYIKNCSNSNNNYNTDSSINWTDILIFILLGIFSIIILDMFFRFGKYIIQSKIQNNIVNSTSHIPYDTSQMRHIETPQMHHMEPSPIRHMEPPPIPHMSTQPVRHMEPPPIHHMETSSMQSSQPQVSPNYHYNTMTAKTMQGGRLYRH